MEPNPNIIIDDYGNMIDTSGLAARCEKIICNMSKDFETKCLEIAKEIYNLTYEDISVWMPLIRNMLRRDLAIREGKEEPLSEKDHYHLTGHNKNAYAKLIGIIFNTELIIVNGEQFSDMNEYEKLKILLLEKLNSPSQKKYLIIFENMDNIIGQEINK